MLKGFIALSLLNLPYEPSGKPDVNPALEDSSAAFLFIFYGKLNKGGTTEARPFVLYRMRGLFIFQKSGP
ncbi:hypothetical protein ASG65_06140 [Bacillus sp. Leaf13]|nr:hypothetical protein ASG65_06140 [Bacillus sp. Leaf13]KRF63425.1 hypothetical protein ASG99_04670 [Bacillus sp. Soil768D1]